MQSSRDTYDPKRFDYLGHLSQRMQKLAHWANAQLEPIGFELADLQLDTRGGVLRLFIDFLFSEKANGLISGKANALISIDDCVRVSRHLDTALDEYVEAEKLFSGPYELQVSSPGLDRPLRSRRDFERFQGQTARVYLYRPIGAQESENPEYSAAHPKQKDFFGKLTAMDEQAIRLAVLPESPARSKSAEQEIKIPLELISKAHLEPNWQA